MNDSPDNMAALLARDLRQRLEQSDWRGVIRYLGAVMQEGAEQLRAGVLANVDHPGEEWRKSLIEQAGTVEHALAVKAHAVRLALGDIEEQEDGEYRIVNPPVRNPREALAALLDARFALDIATGRLDAVATALKGINRGECEAARNSAYEALQTAVSVRIQIRRFEARISGKEAGE